MRWLKEQGPFKTSVALVLALALAGCRIQTPVAPPSEASHQKLSVVELPLVTELPAQLPAAEFRPDFLIESEELAGLLDQGRTSTELSTSLVIIDARPAEEYQSGHLPGAINLRWTDVRDYDAIVKSGLHVTPEQAAAILGKAGIDAQTRVVVYDDGAGRDANGIVFVLSLFGHDQAQMLNGGFGKWVAEDRAVTTEIPKIETKTFVARPRADLTVTLQWLVKNKGRADVLIVDPRDFGEYVGMDTLAAWPANARAGHIPGAISFPWTDLRGTHETFTSPAVMQYLLLEAGITRDKEIITYCNPGIGRSTFLWMALKMLGYEKVRVFAGSFEEWSKHPELPVGVIE